MSSELLPPARTLGQVELAADLADAVVSVPGVIRLEPTLQNSILRAAGTAAQVGRSPVGQGRFVGVAPGLTVTVRDGLTQVSADIAVHPFPAAADTAQAVQRRIIDRLHAHGYENGPVTVRVLAIEEPPLVSG